MNHKNLKCENCGVKVEDKETTNKSIKKYIMALCKKCFKNYEECELI